LKETNKDMSRRRRRRRRRGKRERRGGRERERKEKGSTEKAGYSQLGPCPPNTPISSFFSFPNIFHILFTTKRRRRGRGRRRRRRRVL